MKSIGPGGDQSEIGFSGGCVPHACEGGFLSHQRSSGHRWQMRILIVIPLRVKRVVISAEPHVAAELNGGRPQLNVGDPFHVGACNDVVPANHADKPVQGSERLCG